MLAKWSIEKSNEKLASDDVQLLAYEEPYCGIPTVFKYIEQAPQSFKFDKRLTGSSCIDEVLQEVCFEFVVALCIMKYNRLLWSSHLYTW